MIGPIGWMELTIILIIALLVVGPRGLPKIGRGIGKALREFRKEANELKRAVEFEIDEEERKESSGKKKKKPKKPAAEGQAEKSAPEDAKKSSPEGD